MNLEGITLLAVSLGVIVLLPIALFVIALSHIHTPWLRRLMLCFGSLPVIVLSLFLWHIRAPRMVARATSSDGAELQVIQICNWDPEGFTTSIYAHRPGGRWSWFYYDHQDDYWGSGRTVIDPQAKCIKVYRSNRVTATYYWETEHLQLTRLNTVTQEFGAQAYTPPPL